jgi:hypothetical protein
LNKYICTQAEVKELLQITATTWDTMITNLLPVIAKQITAYCKNTFVSDKVKLTSLDLVFAATAKTITGDTSLDNFTTGYFYADDVILIEGSIRNDGVYELQTVLNNVLTLKSTDTIKDEAVSDFIVSIQRIDYPGDLKLAFADIVKSFIDVNRGVQHFSLADYSVTYFNSNISDFAKGILNNYRRIF